MLPTSRAVPTIAGFLFPGEMDTRDVTVGYVAVHNADRAARNLLQRKASVGHMKVDIPLKITVFLCRLMADIWMTRDVLS